MPRLRPGLARVEYFAVRDEVSMLLAQGHTYASAYDTLKTKGKITMCYGTFRSYANGSREKTTEQDSTAPAASPRHNGPRKVAGPASAFDQSNAPDLSKLMPVEE